MRALLTPFWLLVRLATSLTTQPYSLIAHWLAVVMRATKKHSEPSRAPAATHEGAKAAKKIEESKAHARSENSKAKAKCAL